MNRLKVCNVYPRGPVQSWKDFLEGQNPETQLGAPSLHSTLGSGGGGVGWVGGWVGGWWGGRGGELTAGAREGSQS